MNRVGAVVEGRTEREFVRDVLAPWFLNHQIVMNAQIVGKAGHKGGVGEYPRARGDLLNLLKQDRRAVVTTMFDYYAMPESWPGRKQAKSAIHDRKAALIEEAIHKDIAAIMGPKFNSNRFIPYVQMHEFEAILFSDPKAMSFVFKKSGLIKSVESIRKNFKTPEQINDDPKNAPSKRLSRIVDSYHKPLHGIIIAKQIGVETIMKSCPHFSEWIAKIKSIQNIIL